MRTVVVRAEQRIRAACEGTARSGLVALAGMVLATSCAGGAPAAPPAAPRTDEAGTAHVAPPALPEATATGAGSPEPSGADLDGDTVVNSADRCPADPEDRDNFEDDDGCPDPDNDGDRLLDADDQCPNEAETYNGRDDEDGCPDSQLVVIVSDPPSPGPERVFFAPGSARIRASEDDLLAMVVSVLQDNPQIERLLVVGQAAGDEGSSSARIRLSLRRAEAVVRHLVDAGVGAERLAAAGYGDLCPWDPGHSDEAREHNRRVEFFIVRTGGQCTHLDGSCPAAVAAGVVPVDDCENQPVEGGASSAAP